MIDKEAFLKATAPETSVELPGLGTVKVRGLSRSEAVSLAPLKDDTGALERRILILGLVDPALTEDELKAWYDSAPAGLVDPIIAAIERLSGLGKGAPKSDVPRVPGRPRA